MQFVAFEFENFRGISAPVKIDLTDGDPSFPFVLVGDNEAGKTTILKGIEIIYCLFYNQGFHRVDEEFIAFARPKGCRSIDAITLTAHLSYNEDEERELKEKQFISTKNVSSNNRTLAVSFAYHFKHDQFDGLYISVNNEKLQRGHKIIKWIKDSIPEIVYYNYCIHGDIPDTIRFVKSDNLKNCRFNICNDKLFTLEENLQWQVLLQILFKGCYRRNNNGISYEDFEHNIDFQKNIVDCNDERTVDKHLRSISYYLNSIIAKDWLNITRNKESPYVFSLEKKNNKHNDNLFVDFRMRIEKDGKCFSWNEISQVFRWFFYFKIFTEMNTDMSWNEHGIIFLLDDPESKLPINLRKNFINSLNNLSRSENKKVIYSTYSRDFIHKGALQNSFALHKKANNNFSHQIICEKLKKQSYIFSLCPLRFMRKNIKILDKSKKIIEKNLQEDKDTVSVQNYNNIDELGQYAENRDVWGGMDSGSSCCD
ncbi:AAA family ATPase [Bartonella sp. B30(2025)]